jgi:large subunit ribosomal protein L15
MQIHELKPRTKRMKSAQVGRGGKRGKTSGRGTKGQKARAGHKIRPEIRDMIKRLPKLRGRGKSTFKSFTAKPLVVNLSALSVFAAGEKVTPTTLIEKGIISTYKGRVPAVKILGTGDITSKLVFADCTISASAKEKIEKAGGSIK